MQELHAGHWQVQTLGGWRLTRGGEEVCLPHREQRLVALLVLMGPRPRSYLSGSLWPESTEDRAASNLRTTSVEVRRRAPGLLASAADTLAVAGPVRHDLAQLREALRGAGGTMTPAAEASYLLGVGELLPGWYEDWVVHERERLRAERIDRMSTIVDALVAAREPVQALPLARATVQLEPMRESAHRALARIHLLRGDRVEAWQLYEDFRRRSVTEFGVAPSSYFDELVAPLRAERQSRRDRAVPRSAQRRGRTPSGASDGPTMTQ